jgi:5-oxoprolinase (ATP-hydrolysing) subunit A
MATVDLNADMGESFGVYRLGNDEDMLRLVTSANVACGFHAGDPLVMHRTLSLAKQRGVHVGAHPSFLDPWGFGRRPIHGERPDDIEKMLVYQIGAIQGMARALGLAVGHCKMHGSLANMAEADADLASACAHAVKAADPEMILVVLPGQELERAGEKLGLRLAREAYADRTYDDRGCLVPRSVDGAVIHAPEVAVPRAVRMIEEGAVTCVSGKRIPVTIDTVCVHGDNPAAVGMAKQIRDAFQAAGVAVRPMATFVA